MKRRYKQFHILFWFCFNTITLVSFAIIFNTVNAKFDVFGVEYTWSSLPIVTNILYINTIIGFTLGCGIISLGLFYLQEQ